MRLITQKKIRQTTAALCRRAGLVLRGDVLSALKSAHKRETRPPAKEALKAIIDNAGVAAKEGLAICQDTGLPVVFVELGNEVMVEGDLSRAINKGVESGYKEASFRKSLVKGPLCRCTNVYAPAVIHTQLVRGRRMKVTVLPKGFGCENRSVLRMFNPTAGIDQIKEFIVETVKSSGPDACPPYVVGVGIGGTADYACLLAKKALLRRVARSSGRQVARIGKLEAELLKAVNRLGIGPMGFGGKTTALAVHMETHPTHIAGLPVAVNISCHALRSATAVI